MIIAHHTRVIFLFSGLATPLFRGGVSRPWGIRTFWLDSNNPRLATPYGVAGCVILVVLVVAKHECRGPGTCYTGGAWIPQADRHWLGMHLSPTGGGFCYGGGYESTGFIVG